MTRPVASSVWSLHVGLPKTGTTYLQALLADHRERLREAGVLYPFVGPGAMFLGAVEVRGSREKFGLDRGGRRRHLGGAVRPGAGLRRARRCSATRSSAGAEPDEIAAALAPLDGLEVDVVVTARDLGRQATAHWQEEVKLGDTRSFADFEREQFRADAPGGPARGRTSGTPRTTPPPCAAGRPLVPADARPPGGLPAARGAAGGAVAAVRRGVRHRRPAVVDPLAARPAPTPR